MLVKLTQEQFKARHGEVFDRVFLPVSTLVDLWAVPFRDDSWQVVAVVALNDLDPPEYRALVLAARAVGDEEAVMTDAEAEPRHQYPVLFTWPPDRLWDIYHAGPVGVDAALFGSSGTWGVYFCWEPRIAYLAGTAAFMETFLGELGGIEAPKRGLEDMVDATEDPLELEVISTVLEHVGWDREVMREKHPKGAGI